MCAIAGIINGAEHGSVILSAMLDAVRHRGPDGLGAYAESSRRTFSLRLGHSRLAILDLSDAGAQPMADARGVRQ